MNIDMTPAACDADSDMELVRSISLHSEAEPPLALPIQAHEYLQLMTCHEVNPFVGNCGTLSASRLLMH